MKQRERYRDEIIKVLLTSETEEEDFNVKFI